MFNIFDNNSLKIPLSIKISVIQNDVKKMRSKNKTKREGGEG